MEKKQRSDKLNKQMLEKKDDVVNVSVDMSEKLFGLSTCIFPPFRNIL